MVVASLYGYVLSVVGGDKSLAKHFQPLAVAAFSAGRLVAAPLFGFLMDHLPLRWVVLSTIVISIAGHLLYVFCGSISGGDAAASGIIVARTIVGLGSGLSCSVLVKRAQCCIYLPVPRRLLRRAGNVPRGRVPIHDIPAAHALLLCPLHGQVHRVCGRLRTCALHGACSTTRMSSAGTPSCRLSPRASAASRRPSSCSLPSMSRWPLQCGSD